MRTGGAADRDNQASLRGRGEFYRRPSSGRYAKVRRYGRDEQLRSEGVPFRLSSFVGRERELAAALCTPVHGQDVGVQQVPQLC